jgi:hypothetical protein
MIALLPWIAGILVLTGLYKLSQQAKIGLYFQLIGSTIAIVHFLVTVPIWGYVALNAAFCIISIRGLIKWKRTSSDSQTLIEP